MDDTTYQRRADDAFRAIERALDAVDPDLVDCETAGDVVTLSFPGGKRCIVNTQRPTQQLWLAGGARAWHFSFDERTQRWMDDKGHGDELFATLARVIEEMGGPRVAF